MKVKTSITLSEELLKVIDKRANSETCCFDYFDVLNCGRGL